MLLDLVRICPFDGELGLKGGSGLPFCNRGRSFDVAEGTLIRGSGKRVLDISGKEMRSSSGGIFLTASAGKVERSVEGPFNP